MYAVSNVDETQHVVLDIAKEKKRKLFNDADIENYLMEMNTDLERQNVKKQDKSTSTDQDTNDFSDRTLTAHQSIVRILERRYPLTVTGYKYLNIGIAVTCPSAVDITLGDSHGKEISISPDIWREILEQKRTILSLLQCTDKTPAPIYIGNLTLRFGRINNLPILRVETSTARISLSKSTALYMFNLEHCVNRLIISLTALTDNVDRKFSRLLDIASTVTESANMLKAMYDNESFDRNDIVECELIALVFGEH